MLRLAKYIVRKDFIRMASWRIRIVNVTPAYVGGEGRVGCRWTQQEVLNWYEIIQWLLMVFDSSDKFDYIITPI